MADSMEVVAAQARGGAVSAYRQQAQEEHEQVLATGRKMLDHAVRAGEALLEIRERTPYGQWYEWLARNLPDLDPSAAALYMRLARNKDALAQKQITTVAQADQALRGAPDTRYNEAQRHAAIKFVHAHPELTTREAAEELGMPQATLYRWLNPPAEDKYRRTKAEQSQEDRVKRHAADRQQRIAAMGSDLSLAYALILRAHESIEKVVEGHSGPRVEALRTAQRRLDKAEEELLRASRIG